MADIFFRSSFIIAFNLIKHAQNSEINISSGDDINAILSNLINARILEPDSKLFLIKTASEFLEKPTYHLHDIYRSLDVLEKECDFIQSKVYKNSLLLRKRNNNIFFYDCTDYFTCETILDKLKSINFTDIQEQGFIPLYTRGKLTGALHRICGFYTDFEFIAKSQIKTIQKKSKGRK